MQDMCVHGSPDHLEGRGVYMNFTSGFKMVWGSEVGEVRGRPCNVKEGDFGESRPHDGYSKVNRGRKAGRWYWETWRVSIVLQSE